ncbi:hypothetical protein [Nocardia sp. NPDC059195]|uniref:hypothetical protein n=1 Tax=Nocardia sp. NPDC059195 TaxID=3346765 RepID=UPI0036B0D455
MKRKIIVFVCLLLAAALAGTAGYLAFLRPADNPPAEACAPTSTSDTRPIAVASDTDVNYLPLHERMTEVLLQADTPGPEYSFNFVRALAAATQHYLLGQSWDQVARDGGMRLLIDHIHLNDRGGAIVADLTSTWLSSLPRP